MKKFVLASIFVFVLLSGINIFSLNQGNSVFSIPPVLAETTSSWQVVSPPTQTEEGRLYATSAISASDIWAVGVGQGKTLTLHFDGVNWKKVPSPNMVSDANELTGVLAIASNDVWAVGNYYDSSALADKIMAMHWDGTSWSIVPTPSTNSSHYYLKAISGSSSNDIWAVGEDRGAINSGNNSTAIIMHWDGNSWQMVPTPKSTQEMDLLNGVVAISSNDVWAVGMSMDYNEQTFQSRHSLIMHWDGTSWIIVPSPNMPDSANGLGTITAVSSTDVWAAGSYYDNTNSNKPLTMRWNGSSWEIVPSVTKTATSIRGVKALNSNNIWAVGVTSTGPQTATSFTMHWDGSTWSEVSSPNPSTYNDLYSLTTISGDNIWVVGAVFNQANQVYQNLMLHYTNNPASIPTPSPTPSPTPVPTPTPTPVPDTTAPSVNITYPTEGSLLKRRTTVTITANASDASGIQKVEFYVDNKLICTDTTASYSCNWSIPGGKPSSYQIKVVASDNAANSATTSVSVTAR